MNFLLQIEIPKLNPPLLHHHKILLIGSCFTEHMTRFLTQAKFTCVQNSHGIVFNPISVCKALNDLIEGREYTPDDLFLLDEYWHSWFHHSDFSSLDAQKSLQRIQSEIASQRQFLQEADYVFITLGSAFAYWHLEKQIYVSNNHRAPANWFRKDLLTIETIHKTLEETLRNLTQFNPKVKIVFTISPVRHARDGVIENNRSKARLLEAVHSLEEAYYFPAYELVIDVLRDYRFYDLDMVHPNYQATRYVWEQFVLHCIDPSGYPVMKKLEQLHKARHHRPKDENSQAHKRFLAEHYQLCLTLLSEHSYLNLNDELEYFGR